MTLYVPNNRASNSLNRNGKLKEQLESPLQWEISGLLAIDGAIRRTTGRIQKI